MAAQVCGFTRTYSIVHSEGVWHEMRFSVQACVAAKWLELEDILLSGISHKERQRPYVFPYMWELKLKLKKIGKVLTKGLLQIQCFVKMGKVFRQTDRPLQSCACLPIHLEKGNTCSFYCCASPLLIFLLIKDLLPFV